MKKVMFRLEFSAADRVIVDDVPKDVFPAILDELPEDGVKKVRLRGRDSKILRASNKDCIVYALTYDPNYIKSNRLIKAEVDIMLVAAKNIDAEITRIRNRADSQTKRLIHNIKSLTAKTAQEIYYIALQNKLIESPKETLKYLEKQVLENPRDTAKALLEILKHNTAQRTEFSAFQKLNGEIVTLKKESHRIHKVLMNVLYLFFQDFTDKNVTVRLEQSDVHGFFDYDSIHVCIYHLIENAAKYIMPNGEFLITVSMSNDEVKVLFDMESMAIEDNETDRIFHEGESGSLAIKEHLQGTGIGLFLARRMSVMNGGGLYLLNGKPLLKAPKYARNRFTLVLQANKG